MCPGVNGLPCCSTVPASLRAPVGRHVTPRSRTWLTAFPRVSLSRACSRPIHHPHAPRPCVLCILVAPSQTLHGPRPHLAVSRCHVPRLPRRAPPCPAAPRPRVCYAPCLAFLLRTHPSPPQHRSQSQPPQRGRGPSAQRDFSAARLLPGPPSPCLVAPHQQAKRVRGMSIWYPGAVILSLGP